MTINLPYSSDVNDESFREPSLSGGVWLFLLQFYIYSRWIFCTENIQQHTVPIVYNKKPEKTVIKLKKLYSAYFF